ncbi:Gfo/Idh/MocA family oxidoreductase [Paenibacillus qinlingensis]|uniref:Dehydrogenase n=1 Tax=Paenibacillus qinlingensis TaxID=1837343 RepID=A0ABU1NRV2_9BACL|nr:Gfo/Idh/MocA family oxidoreductase [Paenibacillus qinlingensis]MDR6550084.1 putative dehydrogenase [Paenibacillus qinlingensis]
MLKIGLIGATGHVGYVLEGLREQTDAYLAGIAPGSHGEDMDSLNRRALQYGYIPELYPNYIEMLDTLKPDVVAIASHFNDHASIAVEALHRNIHVFVEKPVATTLADLDNVKVAYQNSHAQLAAMFGIRYTSCFLTVEKLLQEGSVGEVRLLHAQKSYRLGERNALYKRRETYGGTIPWVGSHAIDWLYSWSGERFTSVFASHSTRANQQHGELEATAMCQFTCTNEVMGSLTIDYLRPKQAPSHADDRIRIVGTRGIVEVMHNKVYVINEGAEGIQEAPLLPSQPIFADFLRQVQGRGKCLISSEQSFAVTEACLRARMSADEGRVVFF